MNKEDGLLLAVYGIFSVLIFSAFLSHFDWNSNWVSFLGSVLGSVLAGAVTLLGVRWTIRNQKEDMTEQNRIQNRPYLQLVFQNEKQRFIFEGENEIHEFCKNPKHTFLGLSLKNIGNGIAKDISFEIKNDEKLVQRYKKIENFAGIEMELYKFGEHTISDAFNKNNRFELFYLENGKEFDIEETGVEAFFKAALFLTGNDKNFIKQFNKEIAEYSIEVSYKDIFENTYLDKYKIVLGWIFMSYDEATEKISYEFKVKEIAKETQFHKAA